MIDREQKIARAREIYLNGGNCSQAVFAAFAEEAGVDEATALRVAGGFGGGMGGLRGVCGALSGAFMALGAARGFDASGDARASQAKKRLYAMEQALHARFAQTFEATHCKRLLELNGVAVSAMPADRTPEYYKKRPCARYIEWCAGALADALNAPEE